MQCDDVIGVGYESLISPSDMARFGHRVGTEYKTGPRLRSHLIDQENTWVPPAVHGCTRCNVNHYLYIL